MPQLVESRYEKGLWEEEKEKEPRHGFDEPLDFAALVWAMARDVGVPSLPDADENGAET